MISQGAFFCLVSIVSFLILPGCATVASSFDPQANTQRIADKYQFAKERIPAGIFTLTSYEKVHEWGSSVRVYIEGDGRAWSSRHEVSFDPTPVHPVLFELAALDPAPNVVYLARPCQFDSSATEKPCDPEYWTDKRFSEEVIASVNSALDTIKEKQGATQLDLVGYSGGAAVAVLVAARRHDVVSIRTIAGNLDPATVNRHHGAGPLEGSLDPMSVAGQVAHIPQRHFIGTRDEVVPRQTLENFRRAAASCQELTVVDGATHHEGWANKWRELLELPVTCG